MPQFGKARNFQYGCPVKQVPVQLQFGLQTGVRVQLRVSCQFPVARLSVNLKAGLANKKFPFPEMNPAGAEPDC